MLKIVLNGKPVETDTVNLEEFCDSLGFSDAKIATAVNGDFVPASRRRETNLTTDDRVEIVSPRQGG